MFKNLMMRHRTATEEEIRCLFGEYQNVLQWLASFLTADSKLARASVVDACAIADEQNAVFHDWLIHWAARATVRVAFQKMHQDVAELTPEYRMMGAALDEGMPLSAGQLRVLVENSEQIASQLDVFCRFVLVLRGIAKDHFEDVGRQLGSATDAAERAYSIAVAAINTFTENVYNDERKSEVSGQSVTERAAGRIRV